MKKLFAIICLLASAGIVLAQYKQNSVTTNAQAAMVAFIDSRVVSPTNGVTAGTVTNVLIPQTALLLTSTNQFATGIVARLNNPLTNQDTRTITLSNAAPFIVNGVKSVGTLSVDGSRLTSATGNKVSAENGWVGDGSEIYGIQGSNIVAATISNAAIANATIASNKLAFAVTVPADLASATNGLLRNRWTTNADGVSINGSGVTNLHGTNIQALTVSNAVIANATISTNKMDAVAYAAFIGGGSTQTNISAAAVTNAGTAIWSNSTAFVLAPTNAAVDGYVVSATGDKTKWVVDATAAGGLSESATNGWLSTTNVTDRYGTNTLTVGQGPQANLNSALHFVGGASPHMEFFGPTSYLYVNLPQTNADVLHLNGLLVVDPDNVVYGAGTLALPSATATSPALGDDDTSVATTEWVRDSITNRGPINVMDYGATGDGSTDDTAAIQAALNAVPARGGFVYVPRSATGYRVDGTLYPQYGTTLFGEGNKVGNASALNHGTSATPLIMVTNEGVYVKNLTLLGSGQTAGSMGILFTNNASTTAGANWGAEDVRIEEFHSGINIGNAWIGDIIRARIRACVAGISFSNTVNNVTVSGGSILLCSNAVAGSFTASSANKFVDGLNIERSRFGGINLSNTAGNIEISGCYFEWNTNYGVRLVGVQSAYSRPVVAKNFFTDSSTTQTNIYLINAVGGVVSGNSSTASAASTFLAADSGSTNLIVAYNSHTGTNVIANMGVPQTMFIGNAQYAAGVGYTNAGFVGDFMGLVRSGDQTNAAGSRVAYESDTVAVTNGTGTVKASNFALGANVINSWDDVTNYFTQAGSQTPLTADVNGAGKSITNLNNLEVTNTLTLYNLTLTNLQGTGVFMSLSNGIVVKTNIPAGGAGDAVLASSQTWTGVNTFSNKINMDAAHALYLSNLTTARVLVYNTANGVTNTGATGPLLGTGSAAAWSDINGLAAATVVTNGSSPSLLTVTADGFDIRTNSWTINGVIYMGTNATYTGGAATIGITGVGGTIGSAERFGSLTIKSTGDIVFTNPASFYASDGADSRTFTNGNLTTVTVQLIPGFSTNLIFSWSK